MLAFENYREDLALADRLAQDSSFKSMSGFAGAIAGRPITSISVDGVGGKGEEILQRRGTAGTPGKRMPLRFLGD